LRVRLVNTAAGADFFTKLGLPAILVF